MAAGMSLRITYWGDSAETMAWLDGPPCGQQACSATAGKASISNISVKSFMWVITDSKDSLFGYEVPQEVVEDAARFTKLDGFGVAKWRGATHFARRQARPVSPTFQKDSEFKFLKKFVTLPGGGVAGVAVAGLPSASVAMGAAPVLMAACLAGIVSILFGLRCFQRVRRCGSFKLAGAAEAGASAEASKAADASASDGTAQDAGSAGAVASGRLGLGRSLAHISHLPPSQLRKGSSCQQLLTLAEADV
jgi:hypothetical protein